MTLKAKLIKNLEGFTIDVSFEVSKGITVLFGPSGSGKSLSLKMIAGLMKPDRGLITQNEKILFQDSPEAIFVSPQEREMGYVFQNHSLFPHMTILENILYGDKDGEKKNKMDKAHSFLQRFHIGPLVHKYPHEISGGQQQRVALARALMRDPRVLLLDEPFSALDNPTRIIMRDCLKDILKELQIPIILVTHDVGEAFTMADQMIIIKAGKILLRGSPQDVFNSKEKDIQDLVYVPNFTQK